MRSGQGVLTYRDGRMYEGSWLNNRCEASFHTANITTCNYVYNLPK
eukprot:gene36511-45026_t